MARKWFDSRRVGRPDDNPLIDKVLELICQRFHGALTHSPMSSNYLIWESFQ